MSKESGVREMGLLIMLLLAGAAIWWGQTAAGEGAVQREEAFAEEKAPRHAGFRERSAGVARLVEFAEEGLKANFRVSVQWNGKIEAGKAALLLEQLQADHGLKQIEAAGGHQQWDWADMAGWTGSVVVLDGAGDSHQVQMFIGLESDSSSIESMMGMRDGLDSMLEQWAAAGLWSVKLTGNWDAAPLADGEKLQESLLLLAENMLQAQKNGEYRDSGMVNATYSSKLLPFEADGGAGTTLQTALRQDTETKEWRVAIGSPVLTGEF